MCLRNWLVPLLCVGFLFCYNFKIIEKLQEIAPGAHKYPLSRFTGCLYFVLFGLSFLLCLSSYVPHIHISLSSIFREGNNFMYLFIPILILPPPKLFESKLEALYLFMPTYFNVGEQLHIIQPSYSYQVQKN